MKESELVQQFQLQPSRWLQRAQRIGTGLAFILFPLVFIFAFAVHPGLLAPHMLNPEELIQRAHHNDLLQFAHALVTLNTALLVVVALHFKNRLEGTSAAWAGFVGAALAVLGALMLAADKGALCLSMSAIDRVSDTEFAAMLPGLLAMFSKEGWLVLLWGIVLLPVGFTIQAAGLLKTQGLARWQGILFLIGALLVATPDGLELINLTASILMAIALIPYGIGLIRSQG